MPRWTKEELEDISDAAFINALLADKAATLRRYGILERHIRDVQSRLRSGNRFDDDGNLVP